MISATPAPPALKTGKLQSPGNVCRWRRPLFTVFTCLEIQNHIFSFYTEDGTYYRNELCLDDTHGDTVATQELKTYTFNQQEQELLLLWSEVLTLAKESRLYDPRLTYGLYHIQEELCETKTDPLYQTISKLKLKIKEYYNTYLLPLLFTYQYLK